MKRSPLMDALDDYIAQRQLVPCHICNRHVKPVRANGKVWCRYCGTLLLAREEPIN